MLYCTFTTTIFIDTVSRFLRKIKFKQAEAKKEKLAAHHDDGDDYDEDNFVEYDDDYERSNINLL
jgi:hypothetical protein